jgi:hypothetical protein
MALDLAVDNIVFGDESIACGVRLGRVVVDNLEL